MEPAFITPTLKQRRVALFSVTASLIAVLALVALSELYVGKFTILPACVQLPYLRAFVVIGVFVLTGLMLVFCCGGYRIRQSRQFPAPGTALLFKRAPMHGLAGEIQRNHVLHCSHRSCVFLGLLLGDLRFQKWVRSSWGFAVVIRDISVKTSAHEGELNSGVRCPLLAERRHRNFVETGGCGVPYPSA